MVACPGAPLSALESVLMHLGVYDFADFACRTRIKAGRRFELGSNIGYEFGYISRL